MQIFKHVTGEPALFADVRHYHEDLGVWDFCNSGEHATFFAGRSMDPEEPGAHRVPPAGVLFPGGRRRGLSHRRAGPRDAGASDQDGRPVRHDDRDRRNWSTSAIATTRSRRISQDNWPHAFAKFDCSVEQFIHHFNCNHIHGAYGDWVRELEQVCDVLGIDCRVLR